nr:hypothetical protein [Tanacetum cinerariifolium]
MQAATDLNNRDTPDSLQVRSSFPRSTTQLENVTGTSCSHNDRATLLATGGVGGGPVSATEGQSQESVDSSHGVLDVFKTTVQLKGNNNWRIKSNVQKSWKNDHRPT